MNDLDDHLEMLVEDSSSEDLDEDEVKNEQKEIKATDTNEVRTKKLQGFLKINWAEIHQTPHSQCCSATRLPLLKP